MAKFENSGKFAIFKRIPPFSPIIVIGLVAYYVYAYCYKYCWLHVGGGRGIALTVVYLVIGSSLPFTWLLILTLGPGRAETIDAESPLPDVFMCDPQGYRQWCSNCCMIKADRAHHSRHVNRCVPKMDHFCVWLYSVIGAGNYKPFVQFVFYLSVFMLYNMVTLLIYAHGPGLSSSIENHEIALYVLSGVIFLMMAGFLGVNVRYILGDITNLEHMALGSNDLPIFNIECDGKRVVTRLWREDIYPMGPYSEGKYRNWTKVMGPSIVYWLFPIPVRQKRSIFNKKLLEILRDRFRQGKEGYFAFTEHQKLNNESFSEHQKLNNESSSEHQKPDK